MKNKIRQLREALGITQEQLGEMVETSRQAINVIETEKNEPSIWMTTSEKFLMTWQKQCITHKMGVD